MTLVEVSISLYEVYRSEMKIFKKRNLSILTQLIYFNRDLQRHYHALPQAASNAEAEAQVRCYGLSTLFNVYIHIKL